MTETTEPQNEARICLSESSAGLEAELYMDATDYDHELGQCIVALYASVEDLKASRACVEECGIVAVRVEFVRIVEPGQPYSERGKSAPNVEVSGAGTASAGLPG